MNKIFFMISIFFITSFNLHSSEILNIKWGEAPHNINYFITPDGIYGISDFYVENNEIGLIDKFNQSFYIFKDNTLKYSIENLPEDIIFVERINQKTLLIGREGSVYQIEKNGFLKTHQIPVSNSLSGVFIENNTIYGISRYEKYVFEKYLMDAIIENPFLASIRVYNDDDIIVYNFNSPDELAAITPIGFVNDLLVIVTEFDMGKMRSVFTIDEKGNIISEIIIPPQFMLGEIRDIKIFNNYIYILSSDKVGIKIFKFDGYTNGKIEINTWTKKLYEVTENINYSNNLLALTPVKRSEALALAKEYNDHKWTARSCNVGTTTCTDWCNKQKTIKPPSWVVVGTNTRFPYSWGGFSTISQFDQGLIDCKKAGDIQTKYTDGTSACGSSCSVGVDCSGFVSRLWKQTTKYGTSTIMQIATKISKSDLKPADALNDAGSHIRLFVGFRSDGKWDMVESYAGSGYWGVGYTVRTPAENDGYDAIRYNAIVDDSVSNNKPPVISHTPISSAESGKDILISAKITDDSGKIEAATLRFKNEGESNFTAVNMTDKGSGNYEAKIASTSIKSTTIYYYIAAWDGESPVQTGVNRSILPEKAEDSTNPQYFKISITTPNSPPVITHTPVTSAKEGEDIIISAKITDDSGKIQAANIKYKNEGDSIMKTINMVDKGNNIYEAKISAPFITAKKIYYYIAAWDGESPVQTGRNRTILPEKAEDLIPVYFIINIYSSTIDAGYDVIADSNNVQDIKDTLSDTDESKDVFSPDIFIDDEKDISDKSNIVDIIIEDRGDETQEDIIYYSDIKKRSSDLNKLGEEEEGGCGCTIIK